MSNRKLDVKSSWIFTKQSADFDNAYKAAKLFVEKPKDNKENIETYFKKNFERYDVNTANHRVLVISQLYGLLTKSEYYKTTPYSNEKATEVYEKIDSFNLGSYEYNTLKTEQILKVKIKAIVDTADNNEGYNILPITFMFKVLLELKKHHNIKEINHDKMYSHIFTARDFNDLLPVVDSIVNNDPISEYVNQYKSDSRVLKVSRNLNLFTISNDSISINENFEQYFIYNYIDKFSNEEFHEILSSNFQYKKYLTKIQGFNVNLIDLPEVKNNIGVTYGPETTLDTVLREEGIEYTVSTVDVEGNTNNQVDDLSEDAVYNDIINNDVNDIDTTGLESAHENKPVLRHGTTKKYSKDPRLGKLILKQSEYKCSFDNTHETFTSKSSNSMYMEAHHLIPICFQEEMWSRFNVNIDCVQNLISLCPTCHRKIHFAVETEKKEIIKMLYNIKKKELSDIGIDITLEELYDLYFNH